MYRRTFDRLAQEVRDELLVTDQSSTVVDGHIGTWRMRVYHGPLAEAERVQGMGHFLVVSAAEGSRALTDVELIHSGSMLVRQPSSGDLYPGGISRWNIATSVGTLFMPGYCRTDGMTDGVFLDGQPLEPYRVPLSAVPEIAELPDTIATHRLGRSSYLTPLP
jgi:hypothetical protein